MKIFTTLLLMTLHVSVFSYNWTIYGPTGIHANNILFGAGGLGYDVICTNNGICVNNGTGGSWCNYPSSLPVLEAVPFDANNILLVMGNGSNSDGIYKFSFSTNTFNIVEWCDIPTFIKYCTINNTYYAGTKYDGLLSSTNGITWDVVPYFQGKGCTAMDFYGQHIVVTQVNNLIATYYSDDGGLTWNQSSFNIPIHDIAFHQNGLLYGVYTGQSNSSGLYLSYDFGHTWYMEYYVDDMNTVGFDVLGNILIGFHGALVPYEGVTIYDTTVNNFTFLNTGLPNKNIHKYKINPVLSSITFFACTDTGVYYCNDYFTSVQDNYSAKPDVCIYPNPANDFIEIEGLQVGQVEIIDMNGKVIKNVNVSDKKASIDISKLSSGVYTMRIKTDGKTIMRKLVKE